jgi:spermidine synthase
LKDGVTQLTEKDANSYNEMMAHVAMMQHRKPKRALVIGGGDGYVLSEVLKHEGLLLVDHVDLDGDVIEVCKEHFSWGDAWKDPRVVLHIEDGAAFVAHAPSGYYDVIIQDSSDPWTWDSSGRKIELPSSVLYSEAHFQNIFRILGEGGTFNFQVRQLWMHHDDKSSSLIADLPHLLRLVGKLQYSF